MWLGGGKVRWCKFRGSVKGCWGVLGDEGV